jgi:hypothetical protein
VWHNCWPRQASRSPAVETPHYSASPRPPLITRAAENISQRDLSSENNRGGASIILVRIFLAVRRGGGEIVSAQLLPALCRRGYEFVVVTSHDYLTLPDEAHCAGIPVYRFPFRPALQQI